MLKDFVLEGSETIGQEEIFHYTSVESLFKIVESESLRLCSTKFMNDWKEMLMIRDVTNETLLKSKGIPYNPERINEIKRLTEGANFESFIISFSKREDSLNQWGFYGDNTKGLSIGFDVDRLKSRLELLLLVTSIEAKNHFKLSMKSVIYDLEKQCEELSVNEYRKEKKKTIRLSETDFGLSFYASPLKSSYFSDEKEVRIVYNPNITVTGSQINIEGPLKPLQYFHTNGTLKPFFELKLFPLDVINSITIGPNCRLNENELKRFLVNSGFSIENIKIKRSELPYVAG